MNDERGIPDADAIAALQDEQRRYRRLQIMIAYAIATLEQDPTLTPEQGIELIRQARRAAESLFPGRGPTFDLIYRPRLIRIMQERFGLPEIEDSGTED